MKRRAVPWIGGLLIAAIVGLAAWDIVKSYHAAVASTGRELDAQARMIAEQTARSLQAVDVVLRHLKQQYEQGLFRRMSAQELHLYLREQSIGLVQIEGVAWIDAGGVVRSSSRTPSPQLVVRNLPAFEAARVAKGSPLHIENALRGESDDRWIIPVARRLESRSGEFEGLLVARGRIDYFQEFYRDVVPDASTAITLLHENGGTLLARHPPAEASLGQRLPVLDATLAARKPGEAARSRGVSPIDGVERFAALQPVPDYPLSVVVTREASAALAPWREQAFAIAGGTLALSGLAALLLVLLTRQIAQLYRARESLEASQERFALAVAGSDDGIWLYDFVARQVFASARAREISCMPPGPELQSMDEWMAATPIHPDDAPRRVAAMEDHLAGRTPAYEGEFRMLRPDGGYRWIRIHGLCQRDAAGKPLRMAGSTSDIDVRKRAEEALRETQERYALAVAGSDDGIWDFNFLTRQVYNSARAREIVGMPPGPDLTPMDEWFANLPIHPDDAPRRLAAMEEHLSGRAPAYVGEFRMRHPDGEYRWVRIHGLCIRDAEGRPQRMAGSISDVDARRRAEDGLRESQERFALAVAGSNDGIVDWDIPNDRMYSSPRAMEIMGVDSRVTLRTRAQWRDLVEYHPEDLPRMKQDLQDFLDGRTEMRDGEYRVRVGGAYRWIRHRNKCVRDAAGRPVRVAGSVSDIDAQKRAEGALRESEEQYRAIFNAAADALVLRDAQARIVDVNPAFLQISGRTREEVLNSDRLIFAVPEMAAMGKDMHRRVIAGESVQFEIQARRADGELIDIEMRAVPIRYRGEPHALGMARDITSQKRAEAHRARLEGQLLQAKKLEAIGTLAGGIAHDFNNILAAILGYGEMAQKGAAEGSALRRHVNAVVAAGQRAKSLVARILAFSRSGVGERQPVHVQSVVAEALDMVKASLPPGVQLERRLGAGDAAVMGDPTQIHQVVMNLCANASQAMKGAGWLGVMLDVVEKGEAMAATSALQAGRYVRLQVRDSGAGIPPGILERIFDPFFTTKEVGVGTGLGLSLVHGIVTDLGGGIDVDSAPGQGTTFTVYLPWDRSLAAIAKTEESVPHGEGETVLLVDDEEMLVRLGEEMLAELGYEPVGFTSSAEALAAFRESPERFSLVLSDEAMPEMTGSELARAIRGIRRDVPIVLMSGFVSPALTARVRELGVSEVLAKPLASRDIARSLAGALRS